MGFSTLAPSFDMCKYIKARYFHQIFIRTQFELRFIVSSPWMCPVIRVRVIFGVNFSFQSDHVEMSTTTLHSLFYFTAKEIQMFKSRR